MGCHGRLLHLLQLGKVAVLVGTDRVDRLDEALPRVATERVPVRSDEPEFGDGIEFGRRLHADHGTESSIDKAHERTADAAVAERPVHLPVIGERDDRRLIEVRFAFLRTPWHQVAGAFVDLAWKPHVERAYPPVLIVLGDGQRGGQTMVAPVPDARGPVGGTRNHTDSFRILRVCGDGQETA